MALTYDDGPNDPHTLRLLEVLARHDVRATFFLIGRYVQQRPDIAREIAKAGHVIGNHTFTHPNLIFASTAADTQTELQHCEQSLNDAVGQHSQSVSSSLRRTPARHSAASPADGSGAGHVERDWLGLERAAGGVHRAKGPPSRFAAAT